MILFTILQSKVSIALRWEGKQNHNRLLLSFTTNLCQICCNFMKIGLLITILVRCVHGGSLILEHGVYNYNVLVSSYLKDT